MLEKIKENKKRIVIFNLSAIVLSWVLFFVAISGLGKNMDNTLKKIFNESFVSSLIFLVGIPFVFLLILTFLVVSRNKDEKKKWIIRGVIIPFVIWSVFTTSIVLFYYFFGWSGYWMICPVGGAVLRQNQ